MEEIYQRIAAEYLTYSKAFKIVSTYFNRDPKVFAFNSATAAGKQIGVSETTIIRFARKLGYDGYTSFQQDVQQRLL